MPTKPRRGVLTPGILLLVIALAAVGYFVLRQGKPLLTGSGCQAGRGAAAVALDPEQAAIASTIAGVAHRRSMPPHAVMVAYAAALQESKLHNLSYGDRDSVGVFQQRPSEGWGSARQLKDPVYASTKFFQALATVPHYLHKPVFRAAQAVQHSADGYAYVQYQPEAAALAADFTGHRARAVWCWSAGTGPAKANLAAARQGLAHAFGPISSHRAATPGDDPSMLVRAPRPVLGWAVAAWLVTHASSYGIHDVRYAGFHWQRSSGTSGWTRDKGQTSPDVIRAS
ncbi:MAG TPA: hypothetical protein VH642_12885 [Streptosporangiaceae bacterium]